jgi:hypothetical protein
VPKSVGGIAGATGSSAHINVTSTVDVFAPLASAVAGAVGLDGWSPVIMQNVVIDAAVVGNQEVGGLVGFNGDGSDIYRTRFTGTIRGNTARASQMIRTRSKAGLISPCW